MLGAFADGGRNCVVAELQGELRKLLGKGMSHLR